MSLSTSEAACVYAALALHDDGVEITADKLNALISAAGIQIESIWATIFAKALAGKDIGAFLLNVGSGAGAAPAAAAAPAAGGAAAAAAPAAEAKKEEKKEEEEEEDDDMGFGLFD
ncbi:60s acidic ribosomal protein-domain-containing protein [Polychytrium aggregatum]|uniref:60s acidic ribosomal protein-domain-containing protein n=1 Tax=Polychytrium aggregatum TaxID=110093 RepID=UPI0022FEE95B|nr:60s acidic ribosomal protein-domain-containing protein [Polychytrium aggregatum]KAI9202642.1 60s acidic ribosomal protein-domain-containing protein [Polychytrium aggregatum]